MRTVRVQVLIGCQDRTAASSSHGNNANIYGQCICQTQFQAFHINEVIHPPETKDRCHSLCVIENRGTERSSNLQMAAQRTCDLNIQTDTLLKPRFFLLPLRYYPAGTFCDYFRNPNLLKQPFLLPCKNLTSLLK